MADDIRKFTPGELSRYNGRDGNPVYIAYEGRVYDVTESKMWKTGTHMKLHAAGTDLSGEMDLAPHEIDVLDRYPQIGIVQSQAPRPAAEPDFSHLPGLLARSLIRFRFFERHPHPMTVHFPLAFNITVPLFVAIYLLTGIRAFDVTAFHLLGAAVFFLGIVVIPTGLLTWWINYHLRALKSVIWKTILSGVLLAVGIVAFVMRWQNPAIVDELGLRGFLYLGLVFSLVPIVGVIGWLGATLTFPLPKRRDGTRAGEDRPQTQEPAIDAGSKAE